MAEEWTSPGVAEDMGNVEFFADDGALVYTAFAFVGVGGEPWGTSVDQIRLESSQVVNSVKL